MENTNHEKGLRQLFLLDTYTQPIEKWLQQNEKNQKVLKMIFSEAFN